MLENEHDQENSISPYPLEDDWYDDSPTTPRPKVSIDQQLPDEQGAPDNWAIDEISTMIMPVYRLEPKADSATKPLQADKESYSKLIRGLVKSSGIYALASVVPPLVSLVLAPFLTHYLSPTDYGILTILNTLIGLSAGITQLGLTSAFFRAYGYDYSSESDRRDVVATTTTLLYLVSIPLVVGVALIAPLLAHLLFGRSSLGDLIALSAGVVLLQNLTVPGFAWLRAVNRAFYYSLLAVSSLLITLAANIILVGVLHLGVAGSLIGTASGYASVVILTIPVIFLRAGTKIRPDVARNLLAFGLPLVLNFISYWVLQLSDRYLLTIFGSLAETAKYAVVYTLGSAMAVVVMGPFTLAWPTFMFAAAKREDAVQVFTLIFRWFGMILLFTAFSLSIMGTVLLHWLFPVAYHSAAPIIPIVAESLVFYGIYYIFMVGANVTRRTWLAAVFTTIAAIVNVALNLFLIPHYGAMGAAVSTLLAYVVLAELAYIVNQHIYPVPFETGLFAIALVIGTAFYIGSALLGHGFGTYKAWGIFTCALFLYGGCLVLLGKLPARSRKRTGS